MTQQDPQDHEATDLGKLPLLKHYEERRSYPRIDYQGSVIISSAGQVLNGQVRTLSAEGM